jgi:hypothetical protein
VRRTTGWLRFLEDVVPDVRYAARTLRRAPVFALTAILILALGIGATTALYGAVRAFLLDALPVVDPDRLVRLRWMGTNSAASSVSEYGYRDGGGPDGVMSTFSYPVFDELRLASETLDGALAAAPVALNVIVDDEPELATGLLVSGEYFDVLGVRARLGRTIAAADDDRAAAPVAAISHRYWSHRFGADPGVIGREIAVNGVTVTVVGVLEPEYVGVERTAVRPTSTCRS